MYTAEINNKLDLNELAQVFQAGCKPKSEHKVGLEYERLPVKNKNFKTVDYAEEKGICNFLRRFSADYRWDYIVDDYSLIGLKKGHDTITLEPGCQLELSLEPNFTIQETKNKIDSLNKKMESLLDEFGFSLLEYGISPYSTYKNINIIPKRRYGLMAGYLWGILSDVMMRETAGVQVCLDFESEEDAMKKFRLANMVSPFATAIFANSPVRGGVDTGYKTFRALAWINTDNERCGYAGKFQRDFGFQDYINYVLNTPMIYIKRDNKLIKIRGRVKFDEFLRHGYQGYHPTIEDFKLHANLYFPEVRLRKFIEIRNQDCVNKKMVYSVMAFYKGLFYNEKAMNALDDLLSCYTYNDLAEFRYNVPKWALETQINSQPVKDIAREMMRISYAGLKELNQGEEVFLEPVLEFIDNGITPADLILLNWNGLWNKDMNKFMRYLKSD